MGLYIDPEQGTKEEWLEKNGIEFRIAPDWGSINPRIELPVVVVENPDLGFTAAGIAWGRGEYERFTRPGDSRPKRYFMVPVGKLLEVHERLADYLDESESVNKG
mgnify:CR=1 FL=1